MSAPPRRPPRWGLRTVGFLVLAALAVLAADVQGRHTFGTLGCLVLGLGGAAVCTVKGLRSLEWFTRR